MPEDAELEYEIPVYDPRKDDQGRVRPVDLESYDLADDEYERDYNSYDRWYA
jgi:hypothetical protein